MEQYLLAILCLTFVALMVLVWVPSAYGAPLPPPEKESIYGRRYSYWIGLTAGVLATLIAPELASRYENSKNLIRIGDDASI